MTVVHAAWARRYAELGLVLTWVPPGCKGPRHAGWQRPERALAEPDAVNAFWRAHPNLGMACLLGPSGLVSLDVDDEAQTREALLALDLDLDAMLEGVPRIESRPGHFRGLFRAPVGVGLRHRSGCWPVREDPRRRRVLFELRAGDVADTLPPSVHPDTGQPYRWAVPPRNGFPPLPEQLLAIWREWESTEQRIRAACPWAPPPTPIRPRSTLQVMPADSVIQAFNRAYDIGAVLEAHGYVRRGSRFASPETGHAAGVVVLPDGHVFCHHAGDPLGDGLPHDAFGCWAILEYGGDLRRAVRAAAALLGMKRVA